MDPDLLDTCARSLRAGIKTWPLPVLVAFTVALEFVSTFSSAAQPGPHPFSYGDFNFVVLF